MVVGVHGPAGDLPRPALARCKRPELGGRQGQQVKALEPLQQLTVEGGAQLAVSRRYQNERTVVTTNRAFVDWGEVFPNAACVVLLIDRLMHRAEVVRIDGDSYRAKEAQEREAQRRVERSVKTGTVRSRKAGR